MSDGALGSLKTTIISNKDFMLGVRALHSQVCAYTHAYTLQIHPTQYMILFEVELLWMMQLNQLC